ncbi:MAG: efflux RND transporter periplasmic adaptor subunit [Acidobacteria bacterium]|nr:efflux RND transporter periplasmic adaptor subunit [Acidobacteriota bacterium]
MKKIIMGVVAVLLGVIGFAVISQQPVQASQKQSSNQNSDDKKEEKAVVYNVTAAAVDARDMKLYLNSTATLRADSQIDIFAKAAGQVVDVAAEEGAHVKKGDVLLQLDRQNAELELEQARVNLSKADMEFKRIEESFQKNLVAAEEHDRRRFERDSALSAYNLAEYKVSLTQVVAPFDGTITGRYVELGQTIQPTEKLFNLAKLTPLEADLYIPEAKASVVKEGQVVLLSRQDGFEDAFQGSVMRVSPVVDRETGTVKVTVGVHKVPNTVRPGTYVHVRVVTQELQEVLSLPKKAVVFDSRQNASVFVIEDGAEEGKRTVRRVDISLGAEDGGFVQISQGLEHGQAVVVTGKEALKDGALVNET